MKNLVLLILFLLYSNSTLSGQESSPPICIYIHGATSFTQFMRLATGVGEGDFDNHWKSQLGGNLAIGWSRRSNSGSKWTLVGQTGILLHRTRPQHSGTLFSFQHLGIYTATGLELNKIKWKVNLLPWLAFFPDTGFNTGIPHWEEFNKINNWWFGMSFSFSHQISEQIDITSGLFYGVHVSNIPFGGAGGSLYGYSRDMPFWVNLGVRYYAWGRY